MAGIAAHIQHFLPVLKTLGKDHLVDTMKASLKKVLDKAKGVIIALTLTVGAILVYRLTCKTRRAHWFANSETQEGNADSSHEFEGHTHAVEVLEDLDASASDDGFDLRLPHEHLHTFPLRETTEENRLDISLYEYLPAESSAPLPEEPVHSSHQSGRHIEGESSAQAYSFEYKEFDTSSPPFPQGSRLHTIQEDPLEDSYEVTHRPSQGGAGQKAGHDIAGEAEQTGGKIVLYLLPEESYNLIILPTQLLAKILRLVLVKREVIDYGRWRRSHSSFLNVLLVNRRLNAIGTEIYYSENEFRFWKIKPEIMIAPLNLALIKSASFPVGDFLFSEDGPQYAHIFPLVALETLTIRCDDHVDDHAESSKELLKLAQSLPNLKVLKLVCNSTSDGTMGDIERLWFSIRRRSKGIPTNMEIVDHGLHDLKWELHRGAIGF